ncbi:hypothetical protein AAAC51_40990 [Priestia megaterium]
MLDAEGYFDGTDVEGKGVFEQASLNEFMALGTKAWRDVRRRIQQLLHEDESILRDNYALRDIALIPQKMSKCFCLHKLGIIQIFMLQKSMQLM